MYSLKKQFGLRIKELRKSNGLTQEQLAEKLGMDTPNLCRMENGTHFPQTKNLVKLAEIFDVEIKELFDYGHIKTKDKIIQKINIFLNNANIKEVEFIYKTIKNLKEYN